MTTFKDRYITPAEIREDLGVTRQRVHQIINEQHMETERVGNSLLVYRADYNLYRRQRIRTLLARMSGREETKLLRSGYEIDTKCPICGAYAAQWNDTKTCVNGHQYTFSGDEQQ